MSHLPLAQVSTTPLQVDENDKADKGHGVMAVNGLTNDNFPTTKRCYKDTFLLQYHLWQSMPSLHHTHHFSKGVNKIRNANTLRFQPIFGGLETKRIIFICMQLSYLPTPKCVCHSGGLPTVHVEF